MGLFDKLRDTVTKAVDVVQSNYTPLADETSREYYEIVYGLLASLGNVSYNGIKNYVEHCTSTSCDEEKLKNALSNLSGPEGDEKNYRRFSESALRSMSTQKGFTPQKVEKLIEINNFLEATEKHRCSKEEAYSICYGINYNDLLKEIEVEYDNVLDVVNKQGIKFFREGIDRILKKYRKIPGEIDTQAHIHTITKNRFMGGDQSIIKIVYAFFDHSLCSNISNNKIAAVTLKALHFQKHGDSAENYTTVTEESCHEFVSNNRHFNSEIEEHPFEKKKYTEQAVKCVKNGLLTGITHFWMPDYKTELYYTDKLCYMYWKAIVKNCGKPDSEDPNEMFDTILEFVSKDD